MGQQTSYLPCMRKNRHLISCHVSHTQIWEDNVRTTIWHPKTLQNHENIVAFFFYRWSPLRIIVDIIVWSYKFLHILVFWPLIYSWRWMLMTRQICNSLLIYKIGRNSNDIDWLVHTSLSRNKSDYNVDIYNIIITRRFKLERVLEF